MVNFYVYRITNELKKWTDVPALWKQKVMDKLVEDGYTLNEDGSVVKEQVDFVGNLVLKRMFYGEWISVYSPIYMERVLYDCKALFVFVDGMECEWRSNKYNDHEGIKTLSLRGGRIKSGRHVEQLHRVVW